VEKRCNFGNEGGEQGECEAGGAGGAAGRGAAEGAGGAGSNGRYFLVHIYERDVNRERLGNLCCRLNKSTELEKVFDYVSRKVREFNKD
jgi:hypothetical protein